MPLVHIEIIIRIGVRIINAKDAWIMVKRRITREVSLRIIIISVLFSMNEQFL